MSGKRHWRNYWPHPGGGEGGLNTTPQNPSYLTSRNQALKSYQSWTKLKKSNQHTTKLQNLTPPPPHPIKTPAPPSLLHSTPVDSLITVSVTLYIWRHYWLNAWRFTYTLTLNYFSGILLGSLTRYYSVSLTGRENSISTGCTYSHEIHTSENASTWGVGSSVSWWMWLKEFLLWHYNTHIKLNLSYLNLEFQKVFLQIYHNVLSAWQAAGV